MPKKLSPSQFDSVAPLSRRQFLTRTAATAAVLPFGSILEAADRPARKPAPAVSETLVAQLYKSLNEGQRKELCFPFDHELRSKVDNNWHIVKPTLAGILNPDQRDLVKQIFMGLHSDEYAEKVYGQVVHDSGKAGFESSSCALFGEPGSGKFEFVLTGRHCTRRCDGDSVEGAAFGGPIFYGHAAASFYEKPDHPGNVYWYQAVRANEVFQSLDGRQREIALLGDGREENGTKTVKLTGKKSGLPGIPMSGLSKDQRELVHKVMSDLLAPFRKKDADEAMKLVNKNGFEHLHMSFYKNQDVGKDGVWDVWQIEGPSMLWYFRGDPHVHTWVHIRESA